MMLVPNAENIEKYQIKKGELTSEEARKRGSAGGKASVQARKEKKWFKEEIEKQIGGSIDKIINAMLEKAKKGDIQAGQFLRDTIGEKPTDKVENTNVEMSYEDYIKKVESEDEY